MGEGSPNSAGSIPLAAVLELVAMQLEVAMENAAAQAETLSQSVAEFTAIGVRLGERARAIDDPELAAQVAAIATQAQRALVAMQFHDQLAQRVTHVRDALGDVHDVLLSGGEPDWNGLMRKMRGHYTMEDERRLFDLVLWAFPGKQDEPREDEALPSSVELF
jgi:hydrogenase maturation factor HypF (carbamoyltransferase family)